MAPGRASPFFTCTSTSWVVAYFAGHQVRTVGSRQYAAGSKAEGWEQKPVLAFCFLLSGYRTDARISSSSMATRVGLADVVKRKCPPDSLTATRPRVAFLSFPYIATTGTSISKSGGTSLWSIVPSSTHLPDASRRVVP